MADTHDMIGWFGEAPLWCDPLEWEKERTKLGYDYAEQCLYLSFWPVLRSAGGIAQDCPPVEYVDPPKAYGAALEAQWCVLSKDPEVCRPVTVHCEVAIALSEDERGEKRLDEPPAIGAAWPKPEAPEPIDVIRGITGESKLGFAYKGLGPEVKQARKLEEAFKRYVPPRKTFVGGLTVPRSVLFCTCSTPIFPSIEKRHYGGIWVTHGDECYVQVGLRLEVWAEVRRPMRGWQRSKLKVKDHDAYATFRLAPR